MTAATAGAARAQTRWFYVGMAATFVVIAFGGFIPTYWAKIASGAFGGAPILHIHGALFFGWTLFYLFQTVQVATGRRYDHRQWGLFGISLATAMGFTVVLAVINSIKVAETIGMGDEARRFAIVSLSALVLFAALFGMAVAYANRTEIHKRLMTLAMITLLQAAVARVFLTFLAPPGAVGPPPVFVSVPPGLAVDLLIVVAMIYDWRTRGRPHPVYTIGGLIVVAVQLLRIPLAATGGWMTIIKAVESLAA